MRSFNHEFFEKTIGIVEQRESSDTELLEHIVESNGGIHLIFGAVGSGKVYFSNLIHKKLIEIGVCNVKTILCREHEDLVSAINSYQRGQYVLVIADSPDINATVENLLKDVRLISTILMNIKSITTTSIETESCGCSDTYSCTECNGSGKTGANLLIYSAFSNLGEMLADKIFYRDEVYLINSFKDGLIDYPFTNMSCKAKANAYLFRDLLVDINNELSFESSNDFGMLIKSFNAKNISILPIFEHVTHGWVHGEFNYKESGNDIRFLLT